jgi:hypothetical protein
MHYLLSGWLMLILAGPVMAEEELPPVPEAAIADVLSREDVQFFMNEARQAARAASRGEFYAPDPEAADRAKRIGERMRAKGLGLMEAMLDEIEHELLRLFPEEPNSVVPQLDTAPPPVKKPADRSRT